MEYGSYGDASAVLTSTAKAMMTAKPIIVSRHRAAVAFIRSETGLGDDVPVVVEAKPTDIAGKVVYGNLPLHLAAEAVAVFAIEFDVVPPRGLEYDEADMRAAGARLRPYVVLAM